MAAAGTDFMRGCAPVRGEPCAIDAIGELKDATETTVSMLINGGACAVCAVAGDRAGEAATELVPADCSSATSEEHTASTATECAADASSGRVAIADATTACCSAAS
jgi:hypothetical protein